MASKIVHTQPKKPAVKIEVKEKTILAQAEKELGTVLDQMHGLQCFLRALGEAENQNDIVSLDDLTHGFGYLFEAVQVKACHVQKLIREAQKGGAA